MTNWCLFQATNITLAEIKSIEIIADINYLGSNEIIYFKWTT